MNGISPKRMLERFHSVAEQIEQDDGNVFVTASKSVLRRRKSLPSFRRGSGMNYSTLPLPIRRKATTSDTTLPLTSCEARKCQRKTSMGMLSVTGTLDRSKSIRKAKQTVCAAFEQQLQKFRIAPATPPPPVMASEVIGGGEENTKNNTNNITPAPLSPTPQPPNVRSCGSLTSISSHTSATSGSSNNSEEQKKKEQNRRNWLRDSFRSAFGRSNGKFGNKYPSSSRSACGDSSLCIIDDTENANQCDESLEELRTSLKEKDARLRESDRRLTDIRLAALSYQHEMDQLREEIQTLREERDTLRNSNTSIGPTRNSSTFNGTMNSSVTKLTSDDSDDNKIVVFLETFDTMKKIIGHVNLESSEVNIDEEIKEVLQEYLKHIDDRSLGLSSQSITRTEVSAGCACVQISFSAAVALNEAMPLSKANQLFEASIETRRILIAGGAAHLKHEIAQRLAQILACQELDLDRVADIPDHAIKTAGCLRELDDFSRLFDPTSDEPEAEQKRPLILIINLCLVNQDELVRTLRGRCKTPIVIAIGRDNEITPDCAEIFQIFHLSCSGFDLGLKLRQKYVDYAMMNGYELKVRRIVQTQIKFLEMLHDKINQMLVTYQNANTKLGPEWYLNCPWSPAEFQSWFIRLWNHRLKTFLQANIIEGVKLYGDKGQEWFDIVPWIKNNFSWSNDEMFENMSAADVGLTRIETDPLLLMLQRLEAASKITTSECDATELDYSLPTPIY